MNLPTIDLEDVKNELARRHLLDFTLKVWPQFGPTEFHKNYYEVLNAFCFRLIKNLIVTIPPQHGKSAGSSRMAPGFMFGLNPDLNIALMSYSTTFARKFNRQLQRLIDSPEYNGVFPRTVLNQSSVATVSRGHLRNTDEFEIVGKGGSFKAIGREGALTGNPVDVIIFDDLYKDAMEANSPIVRDNVIDMIKTVADTRLHNNSQQMYVFTRWHEDDAIGYLEKNYTVITLDSLDDLLPIQDQNGVYYKINFEALKQSDPTELDPRQIGEPLYPERHSRERLELKQKNDPHVFDCMYQGLPGSKEGLLYNDLKTYSQLPEASQIVKRSNYTDTADSGDDYLCSVCYVMDKEENIYLIDVICTQDPMEKTEISVPLMINSNTILEADVESNNGGKGFARQVQKGTKASIRWFHQSQNKESRILTYSAQVKSRIHVPVNWKDRWPVFYHQVVKYKRVFKANKYHDAADVLTGIIEKSKVRGALYS